METKTTLAAFDRLVKGYQKFTLMFLGALFVEAILLLFFFPFLIKSALFAITLAALLITLFSFYTLRNYQKAEKEEAMKELIDRYIKGALSGVHKTPKEMKQIAAEACLSLAEEVVEPPKKWLFGDEAKQFKELLYKRAVEEFSGQVRLAPCEVTAHARLARTYILLGTPRRAIEEYKILADLAPQETWILLELAACYRALKETALELATLEKIAQLEPYNSAILYQLGQLYFAQGETSKGFKTFEALKTVDLPKSDELMAFYQ